MKLLAGMLERIQAVNLKSSDGEPAIAVRQGEVVLGVLPDNLKRVYLALRAFKQESEVRCTELHAWADGLTAKYSGADEVELEDHLKLQRHTLDHERVEFFRKYFWLEVKDAFAKYVLWDGNVALREGWKVVTFSDAVGAAHSLQELIDSLSTN